MVFLVIFFRQLERFRKSGQKAELAPLPLLQILWANCQGLFALGPALVASFALGAGAFCVFGSKPWYPFAQESPLRATLPGKQLRSLLLALLFCLAGCCVTPYGLAALALPAKLLGRLSPRTDNLYSANIAENVPPFELERLSPGEFWHFKWFLGMLVLVFVLASGRLLLSHLLIVLGFVLLALIGNRNVLLLYWMAAPIAAMSLSPALRRGAVALRRYRGVMIARWLRHAVMAALLLASGTADAREPSFGEPAPFRIPVESAALLAKAPGEGTIFAADHQGGYLIWSLYPRFRPYIDTRLVLRTEEQFAEYLELAKDPGRFDDFQRRFGFSYVVLPVAYPDRYLGLIAHLYASPNWKLVFTDGPEVQSALNDRLHK
jgi:hypothetical protein